MHPNEDSSSHINQLPGEQNNPNIQDFMSIYSSLRPILFRIDAEHIHRGVLSAVGAAGRIPPLRSALRQFFTYKDPRLVIETGGIRFPNPVGLAAGFDKNGVAVEGLSAAGFGSLEVGSVSACASTGNPHRPRLFRIPEDESIIVNYGVPNDGSERVAGRLKSLQIPVPLGINLVETNTGRPASSDEVVEELILALKPFLGLVDYVSLNLNCPNTTSGKSPFDDAATLRSLLDGYRRYSDMPPTFLKVVPTVDPAVIERTLETMSPFPFVRGIVFGLPTGKPYEGLKTPPSVLDAMPGTLCGRPTKSLINASIQAWYRRMCRDRHVIIGTGGVFTAEDAYKKIRLGATLIQLYTALIYFGPGLVKGINQGLCQLLERDGLTHISEAVGLDNLN